MAGFLPSGKIVFPHRNSEFFPTAPGHYRVVQLCEHRTYAFAVLQRAHRNLKFRRKQALGPTADGTTLLVSHTRSRAKRFPFCCDPKAERFDLFDFDECVINRADGHWRYYRFRHGDWRLLNWRGPCLMSDSEFDTISRRVRDFERTARLVYVGSASSLWSAAHDAGIVTDDEVSEAYRRYGPLWNYAGD